MQGAAAPPTLVAQSRLLGTVPANTQITFSLVLPLRNRLQLDALLTNLYTPGGPAYGHYLTPSQFTAQFAPTQADYNSVVAWVKAQGLTAQTFSHRKMIKVSGAASAVCRAFGLQLMQYEAPDGRIFQAPAAAVPLPAALVGYVAGVVGLDDSVRFQPRFARHGTATSTVSMTDLMASPVPDDGGNFAPHRGGSLTGPVLDGTGTFAPHGGGPQLSGPGGGLTPYAIQVAYDLINVPQTGTGQVLGLLELDGYTASDIAAYEQQYGLTAVPLQNVYVDYVSGLPSTSGLGPFEVTLDIEMMVALAPGAKQIRVYEAPNSPVSVLDGYQRIATDDLATVSSSSWGAAENEVTGTDPTTGETFYQLENDIFMQMAAQGQSMFAAAGDHGSSDEGPLTLNADDPAAQPYVTGVGGTTLTANSSTGAYVSEQAWNDINYAGGGGISVLWTLPTWQQNILNPNVVSNGSTTMRNEPDVALNSGGGNVYSLYYKGTWGNGYGTSFASPLWAAFTALVNQARVADNCPVLGFANPPIYYLTTYGSPGDPPTGPNYTADFHDIIVGNNNVNGDPLHFPAVTGYDVATGWGTFDGANLLGDLTSMANTGTLNQLAGNSGFEQADANIAPWIATPNVISSSPAEPAHSGLWMAWLCGYGTTHTDTLMQTVHIPALATAATLTCYLHIDTAETTTTAQNDTLKVQLRTPGGTVLTTLGSYSNLNANVGYALQTFPLTPISQYAGQTLQIYLVGSENNSLQTSFIVDDFALTITE